MEEMTAVLAEILQECERKGMTLPFVMVAASRNGSVLAVRVPGGGRDVELLSEHSEEGMFDMPITCVVLDKTGEAVRITIQAEEVTYH